MYIGKDDKYHSWEMEEVWLEAVENRKDLSEVTDKTEILKAVFTS